MDHTRGIVTTVLLAIMGAVGALYVIALIRVGSRTPMNNVRLDSQGAQMSKLDISDEDRTLVMLSVLNGQHISILARGTSEGETIVEIQGILDNDAVKEALEVEGVSIDDIMNHVFTKSYHMVKQQFVWAQQQDGHTTECGNNLWDSMEWTYSYSGVAPGALN